MPVDLSLEEIASASGGTLAGDPKVRITAICSAEAPLSGALAFAADEATLRSLETSQVAAVIAPDTILDSSKPLLRVKNPKLAWATLIARFHPQRSWPAGVSSRAAVAKSAQLGPGVRIEDFAYVGERASIGARAVIRAHATVDDDVLIGEDTILHPHVTVYDRSIIGNRVILHAGCVVGADGFGYVWNGQQQAKVPQVGRVVIEDDCEIGANSTIDRATLGETRIRHGTKIDNLVQIAHNVEVGPHTVISALSGISGSSKVGAGVVLAGQVGLGDHVELGDGVIVGAQAGIPSKKKVPPRSVLLGSPARPIADAKKQLAAQLKAAEMWRDLQQLKKRVTELEKSPTPSD